MSDFSIELALEKINNPRSKEYFLEVFGAHTNGHYRSAVVMLWTVVVCDLVYKLRDMRDLFGDPVAKDILDEIEKMQLSNPKSPDWESKLLDLVKLRTSLLEVDEHLELAQLHEQRHLSAHPVLSQQEQILHTPTKETSRAFIRSALEGLLIKPPILTKKIVETFSEDLAAKKDLLPDDVSLERYLNATYLKNLNQTVENELFQAIWKFCFQLKNSDTDANRIINLRVLHILFKRRPSDINKHIQSKQSTFSRIEGDLLVDLILFLAEHPSIFRNLNDTARTLIENAIASDLSLFAEAVFISGNEDEHLTKVIGKFRKQIDSGWDDHPNLTDEAWQKILNFIQIVSDKVKYEAINVFIDLYCSSSSFDAANSRFANIIQNLIELFTEEHFKRILEGIENNNQTYHRRRATYDHKILKDVCDRKYPSFDFSPYSNFIDGLT